MLTRIEFQVDALERDALDILHLVRSWRNRLAPINRVPPEVLSLIPDFCSGRSRDKAIIALTHVCRTWREVFTSRSSLWTDLDCADADKTRVYLERSKSSPLSLWLDRDGGLLPHDPFLQIAPHAFGQLGCLSIYTTPDHLQEITNCLSCPAPLLKDLNIFGSSNDPFLYPALAATLFSGDLPSLRRLCLHSVSTELPWRNMGDLTTFKLGFVLHPEVTVGQFLDFFESTPRLLDVELTFATPAEGVQNGRLVSLAHLRKLLIYGSPSSPLLDHLLIPAGAKMTIELELELELEPDLLGLEIEDYLPKSLDNLRNLSDFTKIRLCLRPERSFRSIEFIGSNGQVCLATMYPEPDTTHLVPQFLALLDTSKADWLEIVGSAPLTEDLHRALLSIKNLRTLTLSLCENLHSFILALDPDPNSINPIPCPQLERLVFRTKERFDIEIMVEVAAARASGGAPFKFVRIINCGEHVPREGVMELLKHVSHVETSYEIYDEAYNYGDGEN